MAKKIGEKIKELRKAKGISQEALAKAVGVTFQAVSKWETNVTAPDVSLIPSIASYFGVSIDELFDYNTFENEKNVDRICRQAAQCRYDDPIRAEAILRDGLKQYPANEKMLTVLVYVLWAIPEKDNELIDTCNQLLACASNEGVRCDALRILAEVYHRNGNTDLVMPVLEQIPEFYFTKTECIAKLTEGQTSLDAARFQMNLSGKSLVEMLRIMAARFTEIGNEERSQLCLRLCQDVLDIFRQENGRALELPGYEWIE